jgi:Nucleotidyl transferase AbiEii toxin, Type IV TA system
LLEFVPRYAARADSRGQNGAIESVAKNKKNDNASSRLERIKRLVIIAMFSDDELMDRLVLKGGNALDIIHQLSFRASVDVDFSMAGDFSKEDIGAIRTRIERALRDTFRPAALESFDVRMKEKPKGLTADMADFWGGYEVEFKLVEGNVFAECHGARQNRPARGAQNRPVF